MSATTIVNEVRQEALDLMVEVFATTPGATWDDAARIALRDVAGLLAYARSWDLTVAIAQSTVRQLALMKETNCTAEAAYHAVLAADGLETPDYIALLAERDEQERENERHDVRVAA